MKLHTKILLVLMTHAFVLLPLQRERFLDVVGIGDRTRVFQVLISPWSRYAE